jgi:uncharacterized protein (DUF4415 family)
MSASKKKKGRSKPLTDEAGEIRELELYADVREVPVNAWPALKRAVREGRAMHIDKDSWFIDSTTGEPIAPHPVIERELKPGEAKPVREVMPELIEAAETYRRVGRPKAASPKVHIGFRLAAEVVASIKATGRGYNARVEQALREAFVTITKAAAALRSGKRRAQVGQEAKRAPKRAAGKRKA